VRARRALTFSRLTGMEVRDYNGTGSWSGDGILRRYTRYARVFGMTALSDLTPQEHGQGATRWIYPVMERVIEAIEHGDSAAVQIGVEFIEEDQRFPFGKVLKSNTARALRRAPLTPDQAERIRKRVIRMLLDGSVPREYREYAKLLRRIGIGSAWSQVEERVNRDNPYVMRYYRYFKQHVIGPESTV
jgi:hypothetical protein